jgi:hypothetical protein
MGGTAPLERRAINLHHSLFVILNLFQDNAPPLPVILNQVQDDDDSGFWHGALECALSYLLKY